MNWKFSIFRVVSTVWGIAGILLLLLTAILRLFPAAKATFEYPLGPLHYLLMIFFVIFMGISEGIKGFQESFAPRAAARIRYLYEHPTPLRCLLAPLFGVGYFEADSKTLITSYGITTMVICLIVLVKWVPQPWRGIIDIGVVFGLTWGILACLYHFVRVFQRPFDPASARLPSSHRN